VIVAETKYARSQETVILASVVSRNRNYREVGGRNCCLSTARRAVKHIATCFPRNDDSNENGDYFRVARDAVAFSLDRYLSPPVLLGGGVLPGRVLAFSPKRSPERNVLRTLALADAATCLSTIIVAYPDAREKWKARRCGHYSRV